MKTGVIIQARMGSTRLPGKILLDLYGKPVIQHVIERLKGCKTVDDIIIATTVLPQDNAIADEAEKLGVNWFRGSEEDVLSRYFYAAKAKSLDTVVRITSDCPLIDPQIVDGIIGFFNKNEYDIVTNAANDLKQRTYPRGLDTEVFSFRVLEDAFDKAVEKYHREHVTPFIYENSSNIFYYKNDRDYSAYRWTLDTEEDFEMIKAVYGHLYKGVHDFYFLDILNLLKNHPEIAKINEHIEQKKIK